MKLTIIGGAGARMPLLVSGLTRSDLPIDEIALYDIDQACLEVMADVARRLCGHIRLTTHLQSKDAIKDASFVFTSIRVGGIAARARDEAAALAVDVVGQETVGPAGFAMAMRTIPHMVAYAREVASLAPDAWIINFTNPVGIITEAVRVSTGARIIGICDTPTELYEEVCHALDVPSAESFVDYFGLNHLGWVREVFHRGVPQLSRLWAEPDRLARVYRRPLFSVERLRELRLLPTEYVYFYYSPQDAVAHIRQAGESRGQVIEELNRRLFEDLARRDRDPVEVYETYIADRDAGYMQIESGASRPEGLPPPESKGPETPSSPFEDSAPLSSRGGRHLGLPAPEFGRPVTPSGPLKEIAPLSSRGGRPSGLHQPETNVTGYDRIALNTVRAIHFNTGAIIPLDVDNRGNIPDLPPDAVVEVPCVVNANGALPLHVGRVPEPVRQLLVRVKEYERLTVEAGLSGDPVLAERALSSNPLVPSSAVSRRLLSSLTLR